MSVELKAPRQVVNAVPEHINKTRKAEFKSLGPTFTGMSHCRLRRRRRELTRVRRRAAAAAAQTRCLTADVHACLEQLRAGNETD